MENIQAFNVEKIKSFFSSTDELQGKINNINLKKKGLNDQLNTLKKKNANDKLIYQLTDILDNIDNIEKKLHDITKQNLEQLLWFKEVLTRNYNQIFFDQLEQLKIDKNSIRQIGLSVIEKRETAKIIKTPSIIKSIPIDQWTDLLDYLRNNSLFASIVNKSEHFYQDVLDKRLKIEISKIPENVDGVLIEDFKRAFLEVPSLNFNRFMRDIKTKLTEKELENRKKLIEETKEKEKLEELKKKQEEQKKTYDEYLRYSEKEFERRRRKRQRKSLSEIAEKPKEKSSIDDEKKKKIEKFKSKFDNTFERKYLKTKDDETDPIDLVRQRKKKREEEYQEFKQKIKKSKNSSGDK